MLTLIVVVLCPPPAGIVPYLAGAVTIASTTASAAPPQTVGNRPKPAPCRPKNRSRFIQGSPKGRNPEWAPGRLPP
ncbi:hypothetical protein GCM10027080_37490 [Pedococcus soli]